MICPHCNYEHGWSGEILANVEGAEGSFYKMREELVRRELPYSEDTVTLFACPACYKTFVSKY